MKKSFIVPQVNISEFETESVLTTSSIENSNAVNDAKNAIEAKLDGKQLSEVIVFTY